MTAGFPAAGTTLRPNYIQRGLWPWHRATAPGDRCAVRAVRFSGEVRVDRLRAAIGEVHRALPAAGLDIFELGDGPALRRRAEPDVAEHDLRPVDADRREHAAVALLRAERANPHAAGTRFRLIRTGDDEVVLGLAADSLILDDRSLYLVLGAVLQAYQDRFRPDAYCDFTRMADFAPVGPAALARRREWWAAWLRALEPPAPGRPAGRSAQTVRLEISGPAWRALASSGGTQRGNGSLGIAALVAYWLGAARGQAAPVLASVLDLRDYNELGRVVGPLTDRVAFRVELPHGAAGYRQVFRKAQAGILSSTAHYLPYGELVGLGASLEVLDPARPAIAWDVAVHLCADPPTKGRSRGAEQGIQVELFREAELLGAVVGEADHDRDGTDADLRLGARDGGMSLIIDANRLRTGPLSPGALADGLSTLIEAAAADAQAPLPHPATLYQRSLS